jgi:hypothetical protein
MFYVVGTYSATASNNTVISAQFYPILCSVR